MGGWGVEGGRGGCEREGGGGGGVGGLSHWVYPDSALVSCSIAKKLGKNVNGGTCWQGTLTFSRCCNNAPLETFAPYMYPPLPTPSPLEWWTIPTITQAPVPTYAPSPWAWVQTLHAHTYARTYARTDARTDARMHTRTHARARMHACTLAHLHTASSLPVCTPRARAHARTNMQPPQAPTPAPLPFLTYSPTKPILCLDTYSVCKTWSALGQCTGAASAFTREKCCLSCKVLCKMICVPIRIDATST